MRISSVSFTTNVNKFKISGFYMIFRVAFWAVIQKKQHSFRYCSRFQQPANHGEVCNTSAHFPAKAARLPPDTGDSPAQV